MLGRRQKRQRELKLSAIAEMRAPAQSLPPTISGTNTSTCTGGQNQDDSNSQQSGSDIDPDMEGVEMTRKVKETQQTGMNVGEIAN